MKSIARWGVALALLLSASAVHAQAAGEGPSADEQAADPGNDGETDPGALSDDGEEARARASAVYKKGVAAYQRGDYPEAVVYFLRADRIISRPEFSYNIARAYDKLGDDANSLRWYRDYLRRAPEAADKQQVVALIEDRQLALMEQGLQQLTVLSEPMGATLVVDGRALGVTPWTGELTPGAHRLELRLQGYQTLDSEAYLPADEAVDIELSLAAADGPAPTTEPAPAPASQPPPIPAQAAAGTGSGISPVWSWVALGVGGAALGASAGFEVARRRAEERAADATTQLGRADAYDQMTTRKTTARILAGAGGALVIGGAVLWLLSDGDEEDGAELAGGCDASGCALLTRGRF